MLYSLTGFQSEIPEDKLREVLVRCGSFIELETELTNAGPPEAKGHVLCLYVILFRIGPKENNK